jgi:hypothetical protein
MGLALGFDAEDQWQLRLLQERILRVLLAGYRPLQIVTPGDVLRHVGARRCNPHQG